MTEDELRAYVEQELRKVASCLEGKVNVGPQTEAILRTQTERTLKELRAQGHLAASSVNRVESFSSLPILEQARLFAMYRSLSKYNGERLSTLRPFFTDEEYRWIVRKEWRVPESVDAELREEATYDGVLDWETYLDFVREHPDVYTVGFIEDPRSRMLLDFTVTPVYPIHYLKVEIKLEGD